MTIDQTFREQYDALQHQWRQRAKDHGHQYLQYLAPRSPVNYVLVGKMTSIGEKDAAMTEPGCYPTIDPPGFNLHVSLGDLILNYGAHHHLCKPGETYYLTDLGKCAIPPGQAKGKRADDEFNKWLVPDAPGGAETRGQAECHSHPGRRSYGQLSQEAIRLLLPPDRARSPLEQSSDHRGQDGEQFIPS